jgi:DNA modification methylase
MADFSTITAKLTCPHEVIGPCLLVNADCLAVLPLLEAGSVDSIVCDPPYGMGNATWDESIPNWLPLVHGLPIATFCGVVGMRDYPVADWTGAWVRLASTQRNGRLRGFNNWEPILFYGIDSLDNDTIAEPNIHEEMGHPTTKPVRLMERLIIKMPKGVVCDPFMGSGTTGVACIRTGRRFIGIELSRQYYDIAVKRIREEWDRWNGGPLMNQQPVVSQTLFESK